MGGKRCGLTNTDSTHYLLVLRLSLNKLFNRTVERGGKREGREREIREKGERGREKNDVMYSVARLFSPVI